MSSSNALKNDPDPLAQAQSDALNTVLDAVEAAKELGVEVFVYQYPHPAVGGKVVFYYWHQHTHYFLLHTRSDDMSVNPGKIDAAGGYFNELKQQNPVASTKEEVLEEHGQAFYDALAEDFIRHDNATDMKYGLERNPLYDGREDGVKEAYVTTVWYVRVTKAIADLAIAGDHEVKEIIHLALPDLHLEHSRGNMVPDIYATIMTGVSNGKIS